MSNFDALCQVLEDMDNDTFNDIVNQKSADVIKALIGITEDSLSGVSVFTDFILCAVAADGELTEKEYLFLKPSLDLILQRETTFEDAQRLFYDEGLDKPKDYKRAMDQMIDVIGRVSPELKDDIVLLCLMVCAVDGEVTEEEIMVCAVDGEVTEEEKDWIRNLIE